MSDSENARIWNGIREFLHRLSRRIAYGSDPWIIFSKADDGDVQRQRSYCEEQFAAETDEFIRQLIRTKELPKRAKNVVRFYAGQRIDWALNFLRVLFTASSAGLLIFQEPVMPGWEFLEWLLITAYNNRFPPQPKTVLSVSGGDDDEILSTVWT